MSGKEKSVPDLTLLFVILVLLGIGVVAVYSSSAIYALEKFGSSTYFLWRQLLWTVLGLGAMTFFTLYDHKKLRAWVQPGLLVSAVLLLLVLLVGREVGGAKRWLRFGAIGFQPSELAKLVLVLFMASYCDRRQSRLHHFAKGLLPALVVVGGTCGLIFAQPDLGTPILILLSCLTLAFIGGMRAAHLGWIAGILVPLAGLAVWLKPYRRRRLFAFLDPWSDTQGASYQLVQSLLALGSGGITGAGLGDSRSKLLYLPEPHTDFIFPIFGEEFGLAGSWLVLFLFAALAGLGLRAAARATNLFSSLLAAGITVLTLYQAILNIAMVTGCIPTKGMPLPFLSFGGSSLVVTLAGMGILLNISRVAPAAQRKS